MAVFSTLAELPKQQTTPPYSCSICTISRVASSYHTQTLLQYQTSARIPHIYTYISASTASATGHHLRTIPTIVENVYVCLVGP